MLSSVPAPALWIAFLTLLGLQERAPALRVEPFQGSALEAQALALERNVPLVVVTLFEGEDWDPREQHDVEGLRRELLAEPDVARAFERGVLALACNRVHAAETVVVERDGLQVELQRCSSYQSDSCSVHQKLFEDVFIRWNEDGALITPFILVQDTAGVVARRWSDGHTPARKELLAAVEVLRAKLGPGLTQAELLSVRSSEAEARAAETRGDPGAAWRAWAAVLALAQATPHAQRARAGQPAALALFAARRAGAQAALAAGEVVSAYDQLATLTAQAAGTPLEKDLKAALRALENDPAHKPALAAHRRDLAAAELLREVDDLLRAGDGRRARTRLALLLRKFEGTPAALQARERHGTLLD